MTTAQKKEARLAKERNHLLQNEFRGQRRNSMLAAGAALLGAVVAASAEIDFIPFCLVLIAAIFLVRSFDANGQLDEVKRRPTDQLYPRLSALRTQNTQTDPASSALSRPGPGESRPQS